MATIQNLYTGNGTTTNYSFTFPYLDTTDIKVSIDGVDTTEYTLANATTIRFNTAPAAGAAIRIYRVTGVEELSATFYPGSAIRAQDLNDNFNQTLYVAQENETYNLKADGTGQMSGNLDLNNNRIINVASPISGLDAVNKDYVDAFYGDTTIPQITRWLKTATAGQQSFLGLDDNGDLMAYSPNHESVYLNGALQQRNIDYLAGDGFSIFFNQPLQEGDVVNMLSYNNVVVVEGGAGGELPFTSWLKTATAGQTAFSGLSDAGVTLNHSIGNEIVVLNGSTLARNIDYTQEVITGGTRITLTTPCDAGDQLQVLSSNYIATGLAGTLDAANFEFTQAGTGAQTKTVESKLQDVVSVKDFGAVGDGKEDDTEAIQAAFNAVIAAASGGDGYTQSTPNIALYVPSGTYLSTGGLTLTVPDTAYGVSIYGDGNSSKLVNCSFIVQSTSGSLRNLQIAGGGIIRESQSGDRYWLFSDLLIYDSPENAILVRGQGGDLVSAGPTYDIFENIFIQGPGHNGVFVQKTNGNNFNSVIVKNANRNGFLIQRASGETQPGGESKFVNCLAMTNGLANNNTNTGVAYANWMLNGTDNGADVDIVENYFSQCTGSDCRSHRYATITNAVSNGNGTITITFTGTDVRPRAGQKIRTGTINGSLSLAGLVITACTDTTVTVTATLPGAFTSGSFTLDGWDLYINSPSPVKVNDQYFVGGNFNYVFCKGGFNIQFTGTRIKQQLELTATADQISWMSSSFGRDFVNTRKLMYTRPTGDAGANFYGVITGSTGIETTCSIGTVGTNRVLNLNSIPTHSKAKTVRAYARVEFTGNDVLQPYLAWSYNIASVANDGTGQGRIQLNIDADAPSGVDILPILTPTNSIQTALHVNLLDTTRIKVANTEGRPFFVQILW